MTAEPRTLMAALEAAAATDRGFRHIRPGGRIDDQSYTQLWADASRVAATLRDRDLRRGSLVGIVAPDADVFLTAFMGVSAAGLVPAPLPTPPTLSQPDAYVRTLAPILAAARALVILVQDDVAGRLDASVLGGVDAIAVSHAAASRPIDPIRGTLDDVALVQFTSGSTREPRGVVLTHRAIAANVGAIGGPSGLAFSEADRGVSWLPLFHDMGLVGMALAALYFARTTTFLASIAFLKHPVEWLRAIEREQGTVSFAPTFAYALCVKRISDEDAATLDLSSWRVAGCGAEPIHAGTLEAFADKFAAARFRRESLTPCYGLAEHTLAVTLSGVGRGLRVDQRADAPQRGAVSSGVSCPGHEIRIVDEKGKRLPDLHIGEIEARGPSVMQGYFDAPDATREVVRDGWLRTGDLGYVRDGELYVCGRRKEMIVLDGCNIFPQDIEWIAASADGIRPGRLVAFGVEDASERVVILVEPSAQADRGAVAADIRRRVSDACGIAVDEVVFAPAGTITMTTSGKPQRVRAKQWYREHAGRPQG